MNYAHTKVQFTLRENIFDPDTARKNIGKQLELAARYEMLWIRTGYQRFLDVAKREANLAEQMIKRMR